MSKRASLAELMGKSGAEKSERGFTLDQLPELLGDAMPDLSHDSVGRHRLLRSLKARFGPNFRALPGVSDLVKQFDTAIALENRISQLKQIRVKKGN